MLAWQLVLYYALMYGLLLSLVLTSLAGVSGAIALDMFVDKYPPAIKQTYGPMSPRAAHLRPYIAVVFVLIVLAVPLIGLFALHAAIGVVSFVAAFVFATSVLLAFNTFDLLILDWLLLCTIQPRAMVLPGTEGMAAYRDYRFHFIGYLKGVRVSVAGGLLIALVWTGVQWLIPEVSSAT